MATDITITSSTPLTLTSQLQGGYIDFTGANQTLVIEPSALVGSPSAPTQTLINGEVYNFAPSDEVILDNITAQLAIIGFSNIGTLLPAEFAGDPNPDLVLTPGTTQLAVVAGIPIYGTLTSNNPFFVDVAPTGSANYNSIIASLELIEEKTLGKIVSDSGPSGPTLTLDLSNPSSGLYNGTLLTSAEVNVNPHPCFVTGTRIATERGEVAVEDLAVGDVVKTASGGARPVRWIGHRALDFAKHPRPGTARPVRIAAGALAEGVPARDLTVSPDHALFVGGVLVQAKDLIDGALIVQESLCQGVTYWHVELDAHDVLLAEGAPAESYLDTGHRGFFENGDGPVALHPDLMQARREGESCAKLVTEGEALASVRRLLAARKAALGYGVVENAPWLRAGGMFLAPRTAAPGELEFTLPEGTRKLELITGSFAPSEVEPDSDDCRRLGIALHGIVLDGKALPIERTIPETGRHPRAEGDSAIWTRGDTALTLPRSGRTLTLRYSAIASAWRRRDESAKAASVHAA